MSEYNITQKDINLLSVSEKTIYLKLELQDKNGLVYTTLEGNLINDSFTIDSESAVRRTYNCTFYCDSENWEIGSDKYIWLDRYVVPYIGYQTPASDDITWYKQGTFVMDNPSYQIDESTHTISLSCLDLMCTLDGTRGGIIDGDGVGILNQIIETYDHNSESPTYGERVDVNIHDALVSIATDAGIPVEKQHICHFSKTVPYDIEVNVGTTYYDFLNEIVTLYSGYEMFFDIDGVFTVQLTPILKSDFNVLDANVIQPLVISESKQYNWQNIKNVVEVYGQQIEVDYYCEEIAGTKTEWVATISDVTKYENLDKYALKIPEAVADNGENLKLSINGLESLPVYNDDGNPIAANKFKKDKVYCFRYKKNTDSTKNCFVYLGEYQAYGLYEETASDNPFSTTNLGYKIHAVVEDESIYSESLAEQRALYECYKACWLQDTISLEMVNIPFLTVNQKIGYTPVGTTEEQDYVIKNISRQSSDNKMSVTMARFSEMYPDMSTVYEGTYAASAES